MKLWLKSLTLMVVGLELLNPWPVSAQTPPKTQPISFISFNATYHLSRDSQNHSLLTTEEVILADFPASTSYYGITRAIPLRYQGRSINIKVNSVTDAAGDPVPFKISKDNTGDLVITTGDPTINLYGNQTFHINYQTRDVVNTNLETDQFLLDINGRGWNQSFGKVSAVVHIPKSFASSLIGRPGCYIGYLNTTTSDCSVDASTNSNETLVTVKSAGQVEAHHTLVVKTNFKNATFSTKDSFWQRYKFYFLGIVIIGLLIVTRFLLAKS